MAEVQDTRIRVRFAPSPTGHLHIGGARTALFNYLFARQRKGAYILRIEDTDRERSKREYEEAIFKAFDWLGIKADEGVIEGGEFGPYRQSERTPQYREALERLIKDGTAFFCDHPAGEKGSYGEVHWCSRRDEPEARTGIIRFKTPRNRIIGFVDLIRGEVSFNTEEIGDFSLAKTVDEPLYNLANAVDDGAMRISHVLRGEEHISNTPRQILLQEALDLPSMSYGHFPLILAPDRTKLSKRHGSTSVVDYQDQGYLPEALVNFMALLGWHPGGNKEILSMEELAAIFSLERIQPSGAIFDTVKLDWMNGEYIRALPPDELIERTRPFLAKAGIDAGLVSRDQLREIARLEQPRIQKLAEMGERVEFYFTRPKIAPEILYWKSMTAEELKISLGISLELLESLDRPFPTAAEAEAVLLAKAGEMGDRGKLLWPLRAALSGRNASPGPFEIISILGRDESIQRVKDALKLLGA